MENFNQETIRFNAYCLLRKYWVENNTFELILSFKKMLIKIQYCSIHIIFFWKILAKRQSCSPILSLNILIKGHYVSNHIVFIENDDRKTIIRLNLFRLLRNFWPKDNIVQTYSLFGIFPQKIIWFSSYSLFRKLWSNDNTVQPILSLWKILTKRQYGSTHTVL